MPFTGSATRRQDEARDELGAPLLDQEEVDLVGAREDLYAASVFTTPDRAVLLPFAGPSRSHPQAATTQAVEGRIRPCFGRAAAGGPGPGWGSNSWAPRRRAGGNRSCQNAHAGALS
jgi:hypothetical protein